jgi:hypothetical protein
MDELVKDSVCGRKEATDGIGMGEEHLRDRTARTTKRFKHQ